MKYTSLDDSIGYLLGISYRKLTNLLQHRIRSYDMTPEQWSVLYRINERDGLIQKEIAERSGKDKPTTTRILDLLEAKGYIVKKPGEKDRRAFLVYITEAGKEVVAAITPIEKQLVEEATVSLSDNEYAYLLELLARIDAAVDKLTEKERGEME
ncbi:MarR family winged helix-turn-helix transcriptional regulator [Paenibacillus thailandensis]|uniref:MarR family winged helix-turn-helix transcriptional regulator n=1 Tax=Paenibacillus thailandensis TaxID=393250 RepID=A0ABW5QTA8_9BACL